MSNIISDEEEFPFYSEKNEFASGSSTSRISFSIEPIDGIKQQKTIDVALQYKT